MKLLKVVSGFFALALAAGFALLAYVFLSV